MPQTHRRLPSDSEHTQGTQTQGAASKEVGRTSDATASSGVSGSTSDPIVRFLLLALVGVVVLFLVAIVSSMLFGFLRPPQAPRTLAERDLAAYGSQVQAGKADAQTTAKYAAALINSGQLARARTVLAKALSSAKADRSFLYLQQAGLEFVEKDYAKAAQTAEKAQTEAEKELKARLADLKKKNITPNPDTERPESWLQAVHLRADALSQLNKTADAIKAFDLYLSVSPMDSDILTVRGELKAKLGDKAGAEKDFREALKYVPDYQPALDGLDRIGAEGK